MQRRSFLKFFGVGAAAVTGAASVGPALAKAVQSPALVTAAPYVGMVLPIFEEVFYSVVVPAHAHRWAGHQHAYEIPCHDHGAHRYPEGMACQARAETHFLGYQQWDGVRWNKLSREAMVALALGKGTCG